MKELNNILIYFCCLIVLIMILIMTREFPVFNKSNFIESFKNI